MPLPTEIGKKNFLQVLSQMGSTMHHTMYGYCFKPRPIEILEDGVLALLGLKNLGCYGKIEKGWSWILGLCRMEVQLTYRT